MTYKLKYVKDHTRVIYQEKPKPLRNIHHIFHF